MAVDGDNDPYNNSLFNEILPHCLVSGTIHRRSSSKFPSRIPARFGGICLSTHSGLATPRVIQTTLANKNHADNQNCISMKISTWSSLGSFHGDSEFRISILAMRNYYPTKTPCTRLPGTVLEWRIMITMIELAFQLARRGQCSRMFSPSR